jgi:DNA-binding HxlR family transcriptional regulator
LTIELLKNLRTGREVYSELLNLNEQLTSKVLSKRLNELYELGIIYKIFTKIMPVKAE